MWFCIEKASLFLQRLPRYKIPVQFYAPKRHFSFSDHPSFTLLTSSSSFMVVVVVAAAARRRGETKKQQTVQYSYFLLQKRTRQSMVTVRRTHVEMYQSFYFKKLSDVRQNKCSISGKCRNSQRTNRDLAPCSTQDGVVRTLLLTIKKN